jgi:hypothetical protein
MTLKDKLNYTIVGMILSVSSAGIGTFLAHFWESSKVMQEGFVNRNEVKVFMKNRDDSSRFPESYLRIKDREYVLFYDPNSG